MGNIILKITALICAMALWFYVISLKDFQLTMEVPLTFVKLPEALAIASKPPSTVSVTVEGKPLDLIRLQSQKQSAMVVDMHNAELGSKRIHLDAKNFVAPNFSSVHYIEPDKQYLFIDVAVDTRIERSIPIKNNVAFNAAPARLEFELVENEYGDGGFDLEVDYAEGMFDRDRIESAKALFSKFLEGMILRRDDSLQG